MADYHVLDTSQNQEQARVAFHILSPVGNNVAGIAWFTAIEEFLTRNGATIGSVVPGLAGAELTNLQAGTLFEHVEQVRFSATISNAAKQSVIDDRLTALQSTVPTKLQAILKFWGLAST